MSGASIFGAWLLRTSMEASVLIAFVFALRFALRRRLSPRWQYALWLLVVLRLALPAVPASPTSVFNLARVSSPLVRGGGPRAAPSGAALPSVVVGAASTAPRDWPALLVAVWAAVAALLLARVAVRSYRLTSRVCRQRPVTRPDVVDLLEDCKLELAVHIPINVVQSAEVSTPALLGFLRPRLLLPERLLETFDRDALRLLFLHELAHVKRRDILVNWVATLVHVLHWFNPLVAVAMARMRADRELATDSLVLSHRGESQNRPYGDTLIRLVEFAAAPSLLPGTVGVLEDKAELKRRVAMIAVHKSDAYRRSLLAAVVLLVLAGTTLTGSVRATTVAKAPVVAGGACAGQPDVVAALRTSRGDLAPQLDALSQVVPASICLTSLDPNARVLEERFLAVKGNARDLADIAALVQSLQGPMLSKAELRGTTEKGGVITFEVWAKYGASEETAAASARTEAAQAALASWLVLVDGGQYGASWEQAGADFRIAVARADWEAALAAKRGPLGAVLSRTLSRTQYKTSIPGAPDGEYVALENKSAFTNSASTTEGAVLQKQKNGEWRIAGYYVQANIDTSAAEKALGDWLALMDAEKYGPSWDAASAGFRKAVARAEWERKIQAVRGPLGGLVSRKIQTGTLADQPPGAPAGRYVVVETQATFAKKTVAVETCTLQEDMDGGWRVAGYYIR